MGHRSRNHSVALRCRGISGSPRLGADRLSASDRPERFLFLQHGIDGLQYRPGDRHPAGVVPMVLRDSIIERSKLRGAIDRMHGDFHQNPPQPRASPE